MKPAQLVFWLICAGAIFCLAMLFVLWLGIAAQAADVCITEDQVKTETALRFPDVAVTSIGAKQIEAFMAGYNKLPPQSNFKADDALVLHAPKDQAFGLLFMKHGCIAAQGSIDKTDFDNIMGAT